MSKVIIYTHNPVRDPITDDCLSAALREKGHHVWRRNYLNADKEMVIYIKPDVIVMPEIRCEYSLDFAKQCKEWGCQIVVRPCEVGISEESIDGITEDYRKAIFGENWPVNDHIDLMLCWGEKMKDLFVKHGGIDESKMAVVGGIAFDQFFLPPCPDKIERTEMKRVLFATGFAYADRNADYSVPEAKQGDPLHLEMVKADREGRSKWFKAIKQFWAERGDKWEIWVKPHPGEMEQVYKAVLKDTVEIAPHLPPVRGLKYVDCVVHAGSTMAYEAHLQNMPAINFGNVCQDVVVSKISPNVDTIEGLVDAIDTLDLAKSNANPEVIEQLERDYYGTVDGKASERAADIIDALPDTKTSIPDEWPPSHEMKYKSTGVLKNVEQWHCKACEHQYFIQGPREMVKCPFCGIANVKMPAPQA